MRVLITGLPLFSQRLAEDLQAFDPENEYLFYNTYYSKLDLLKFIWKLPKADLVISMNGVTDKSRTLDMVLKFKKKLVLQWMGSDVMYAMERHEKGTISRRYVDYALNYVDASWLKEELYSIHIPSELLPFKFYDQLDEPVLKYNGIEAVTYISQNRQDFYGMNWVRELARNFPAVPFHVYGAKNEKEELTNIKMYGWQDHDTFKSAVKKAPIFLRLTEHDGNAVSIMEAQSFGSEVLTRLPFENSVEVKSEAQLMTAFSSMIAKIEARNYTPNAENIEFVKRNYNKDNVLLNYVNTLKSISNPLNQKGEQHDS